MFEKANLTCNAFLDKTTRNFSCREKYFKITFFDFAGDDDEEELPKPSDAAAKVEETLLNLKDTNTTTDLLS